MKKNNGRFFALLVALPLALHAYDDNFDDLDAFTDTLDWHYVERTALDVTPQMVLDFICADPLLLQDRLQNDLYLFTFPGNRRRRSLLDYPYTLHDYTLPCRGLVTNLWFFYNQTSVDNFTEQGTTISSYWNLNDENIIGDIDLIDFGINFPDAVQLFSLLKMQERRNGFMFGAYYLGLDGWNIEAKIPLYYNERNFFLTPDEKMLLENSILFDEDDSGATDQDEINKHFVSDGIGIGDTRLSAGLFIIDQENFQLNVGVEMTLPTAAPFIIGLKGSNFPQNSDHPPFDLLQIFQLALGSPPDIQAVKDISIAFISSIFDKLSANLLQVEMGNSGHIGVAGFFENFLPLNNRFEFVTRGAVEYLFPASEKRFYITKKFPQEFTSREPYIVPDDPHPAESAEKLAFLNEQLINTFIPMVFPTTIYPGFLVKFSSELIGNFGDTWQFGIGYDLWWQDKEKLGTIKADSLAISNIRTDIASRPGAFQNKIFGSVNYYHYGRWFDWYLTAYGDYTVINSGIGKDFTLSFRFTAVI
jgi:hypothetical protein